MDFFRAAISRPIPPKTIARSTMQDVMKPQQQTNFHKDENQLLENGLRPLFLTQNSVSLLLTAQTPVRDEYQKKKYPKRKNPNKCRVAYTYAHVRIRPPNWTYVNIRN